MATDINQYQNMQAQARISGEYKPRTVDSAIRDSALRAYQGTRQQTPTNPNMITRQPGLPNYSPPMRTMPSGFQRVTNTPTTPLTPEQMQVQRDKDYQQAMAQRAYQQQLMQQQRTQLTPEQQVAQQNYLNQLSEQLRALFSAYNMPANNVNAQQPTQDSQISNERLMALIQQLMQRT